METTSLIVVSSHFMQSERGLVQVAVQVLHADPVVNSEQRPLQDRLHAFDPVCVGQIIDILLR